MEMWISYAEMCPIGKSDDDIDSMIPCTLRQLEIFIAAAEDCHFGRTANRLGISQPGITSHISNLEKQLGKQLFVRRKGRTPLLSADGMELLKQAEDFLAGAEKIRKLRVDEARSGSLVARICAGSHLLQDCLVPALPDIYKAHPNLTLHCHQVASLDEGLNRLDLGLSDLCVFTVSHAHGYAYKTEILRPVRFRLYGGTDFAAFKSAPKEDIAHLPFLLPMEHTVEYQLVKSALVEAGVHCSNVIARTQFSNVVVNMVKHNQGVAALFETMMTEAVAAGEVVEFDVTLPDLYRCMFKLDRANSTAINLAQNILRDVLAQ